jgi:hypothetical protein
MLADKLVQGYLGLRLAKGYQVGESEEKEK